MDKRDFIFPGVILGLVIIIALGLLLTHSDSPQLIPTDSAATSTVGMASTSTSGSTTGTLATGSGSSASHTPSAYYPYGSLTLSVNQAAQFKDGVAIRPLQVTEDSRCPSDVQCIQAGTVKISLKTNTGGADAVQSLELGHSVTVGGDTIKLESVSPQRTKDGAITAGSYRLTFTITHGGSGGSVSSGPCYIGGCSAQLCTDAPGAISNCLYSPSYGCYRHATCERQTNGACGWAQTPALTACLANPPQV